MSGTNSPDYQRQKLINAAKNLLQNQNIRLLTQDNSPQSDQLSDPIEKCKNLMEQLKKALTLLLTQLVIVTKPPPETALRNVKQPTPEHQFQLLGRYVENFNRVCDLLIVNLNTACESLTISAELRSYDRYHEYHKRLYPTGSSSIVDSLNLHVTGIIEFKKMIDRFTKTNNESPSENKTA